MTEVAEKKGVVNFLKETRGEMRKVTWPTRSEITNATVIILCIMICFGLLVGFLDAGLAHLVKILIRVF